MNKEINLFDFAIKIDTNSTDLKRQSTTISKFLSIKEFMQQDFPEQEYLVDKLIPFGGITILSASPASMKSFLSEYISYCITSEIPVFDTFKSQKVAVLIVDLENLGSLVQRRLNSIDKDIRDKEIYIFNRSKVDQFNIEDKQILNEILDIIKQKDIKLVVFDSLIRIHRRDEDKSTDMSIVFEKIKQIQDLNCTVLIIHHNRKKGFNSRTNAESMRGSSDIHAIADSVIILEKDNDNQNIIKVTQEKNRNGENYPSFEIEAIFGEDRIDFIYKGDSVIKPTKQFKAEESILKIIKQNPEGISRKEILEYIGEDIGRNTVDNVLKKIESDTQSSIKIRYGNKNSKIYYLENTASLFPSTIHDTENRETEITTNDSILEDIREIFEIESIETYKKL
jgi:archaellum biogenesis ATPase FlaH